MSAYATPLRRLNDAAPTAPPDELVPKGPNERDVQVGLDLPALDGIIAALADRVAEAIAVRLTAAGPVDAQEWLDSRDAAAYLGLHRDTLRKLAAERAIPAEQEGPGCKLFFLRRDLDEWRRAGGRGSYLRSALAA